MQNWIKILPTCKVAHFIRQSYLYKIDNKVYDYISKEYPLTYYYVQEGHTNSFYYNKNDLIAYYTNSAQNNVLYIIPLYNQAKNDYEIVLSNYEYNFNLHHNLYIVKAPNRQIYLLREESNSNIIVNVSTGKLLYNSRDDFSNPVAYLFRSMPIANSFVVSMIGIGNEIVIHVIDLIKQKTYEQRCSIEEIKESILILSKNNRYYDKLRHIESLDKLYIEISVKSNIDTSFANLVFYDRYIVNIGLYLGKSILGDVLKDAISLIAIYQNNELTVKFQINREVRLKTSDRNYEIDFSSATILTSGKYKVDNEYDISQSNLYSVIISVDDYTIIKESNRKWSGLALYYRNGLDFIFPYGYFSAANFSDILFIRASEKRLAFASKGRLMKMNTLNRYYIECAEDDDTDTDTICLDINIIDAEVVRKLLLDKMSAIDDTSWVGVEITDNVKHVSLRDKLEKTVRLYTCPNEDLRSFDYAYYIDYRTGDFYSLVYFRCKLTKPKKYRIYIFKCSMNCLLSSNSLFRLVENFETNVSKSKMSIILHNLKQITSSDNRILRLLSNKFNSLARFIGLKLLEMYDKRNAYYDYGYNRRSIRMLTTNTSIASTLHLVIHITQVY
jgi:hypothetical protein